MNRSRTRWMMPANSRTPPRVKTISCPDNGTATAGVVPEYGMRTIRPDIVSVRSLMLSVGRIVLGSA